MWKTVPALNVVAKSKENEDTPSGKKFSINLVEMGYLARSPKMRARRCK